VETDDRVDPELVPALEMMPDAPLNQETLAITREFLEQMTAALNAQLPPIEGITQEDRLIPGPEGAPDVRIRIYRPTEQTKKLPGFFWIHGGGYVMGSIDRDDYGIRLRMKAVDCVTVSVDYRRAPEAPFPAPLEDCYTGLKWCFDHADEIGVDTSRVAIGGGSAGGGLAAALALLVRDRAEMDIVFQMLIYPMIDDSNVAPASEDLPDTYIWSRAKNLFGWTSYLGKTPGSEGVSPYAAAFRATDLTGLPPAIIVVGDLDLFVNENIEYARRLIQAGIPTELHVYPGAYHGFNGMAMEAAVSQQCNAACTMALEKALRR
jgi:acetyl esterase/lipase